MRQIAVSTHFSVVGAYLAGQGLYLIRGEDGMNGPVLRYWRSA
ncbi:MAG: hypothetical protein M2R45_00339 [Verrucomicrobia subdivision 3 bacterium]|nr:hypothetical protein [Limisphaerales bacterium]MCS1412903.1 hypothetical protein [Limisphaerales bacterium]